MPKEGITKENKELGHGNFVKKIAALLVEFLITQDNYTLKSPYFK